MFRSFNIKQTIAFGFLCLITIGCSSYTPYRYSFSLIGPQNETGRDDVAGQAMGFDGYTRNYTFTFKIDDVI